MASRMPKTWLMEKPMGRTLIYFAAQYGTPYAVYEAEQASDSKIKLLRTDCCKNSLGAVADRGEISKFASPARTHIESNA
jgi:hypothetical protein